MTREDARIAHRSRAGTPTPARPPHRARVRCGDFEKSDAAAGILAALAFSILAIAVATGLLILMTP